MTIISVVICSLAAAVLAWFTGWFVWHERHAGKDQSVEDKD